MRGWEEKERVEQREGGTRERDEGRKEDARLYRSLALFLTLGQSAKAEQLENEVTKYRQKAEDAEYLKKRVQVTLTHHPM